MDIIYSYFWPVEPKPVRENIIPTHRYYSQIQNIEFWEQCYIIVTAKTFILNYNHSQYNILLQKLNDAHKNNSFVVFYHNKDIIGDIDVLNVEIIKLKIIGLRLIEDIILITADHLTTTERHYLKLYQGTEYNNIKSKLYIDEIYMCHIVDHSGYDILLKID